jgi:hypothetical protein
MSEPERLEWNDERGRRMESEDEPHPVELLAKLMRGESGASASAPGARFPNPMPATDSSFTTPHAVPPQPIPVETRRPEGIPAAARALAAQPNQSEADPSSMQRSLQALRTSLPLLQRILPLLEGNVLGTLAGIVSPAPYQQPAPAPPASRATEPAPFDSSLAEMKAQHLEFRSQLQTQDATLKKLSEDVDRLHEATERQTLEQEELIDELKNAGKRMNIVAFLAFALLAASIALNVVLYMQIHRLLP